MALIGCPKCAKGVSDRAAACPGCGYPIAPTSFPANAAGINDDSSYFSGSVFDFGIIKCIKTEANNFWLRKWGKSVYTSKAHGVQPIRRIDKTKGQITKTWALGLLGILGLHFFPIGRFITGALRFFYGTLMLVIGIVVTYSYRAAQDVDPMRIMLVFLVAAFVPSFIDLIIIRFGKFRDVFRSHVK